MPQLAVSIICDDIRQEVGRKVSLMGIYDEKILLSDLPVRVAKLCIFQVWSQVPRGAKVALELRGTAMVTPIRTQPQATALMPNGGSDDNPKLLNAKLLLAFAPLDLASEGTLEFLTYWEGADTPEYTHVIQVGRLTKEEAAKIGLA